MLQSFDAIYEDGVLKPTVPLPLNEHEKVHVILSKGGQPLPAAQTGVELVAYWREAGLIGKRADIVDSQQHARAMRTESERRNRA